MKLLFDENVSPRLVAGLSDVFPGSVHVRDVGLDRATDAAIWGRGCAQHDAPRRRRPGRLPIFTFDPTTSRSPDATPTRHLPSSPGSGPDARQTTAVPSTENVHLPRKIVHHVHYS